jgi:hypothetical protein
LTLLCQVWSSGICQVGQDQRIQLANNVALQASLDWPEPEINANATMLLVDDAATSRSILMPAVRVRAMYAHLATDHLAPYAERLGAVRTVAEKNDGTNTAQR